MNILKPQIKTNSKKFKFIMLTPLTVVGGVWYYKGTENERRANMKTKQEQINKLANTIFEIICRENIDRFIEDKNGNLMSVETVGIEGIAKAIIQAGYGDVSEYKAEIRELKADLDHQIDATNDAENFASHLQDDYDKCFKRLKSMQKELNELKDKLKSVAYVEPIKDVVIIKRSDFDNFMEENKQ